MKTAIAPGPMLNLAQQADRIKQIVCDHYGVTVKELMGLGRPAHVVRPRQVAMSIARELLGLSTPRLAEVFNREDHGTILHACTSMDFLMECSTNFFAEYMQLKHAAQLALGLVTDQRPRGALKASVTQKKRFLRNLTGAQRERKPAIMKRSRSDNRAARPGL